MSRRSCTQIKRMISDRLAHRWNCALLLDEADVLLAKPISNQKLMTRKADLTREAVTAVPNRDVARTLGLILQAPERVCQGHSKAIGHQHDRRADGPVVAEMSH